MSSSAMLLGVIFSATMSISFGFQILGIPSPRKRWYQHDIHVQRDVLSSMRLHAFPRLRKSGGSRNHTRSDATSSPSIYVEEDNTETAEVVTTSAETVFGDNDIFPFKEPVSMQEITNLKEIIQRTFEEEICGNEKDDTPLSLDDSSTKISDDYGYATECKGDSSTKKMEEIPFPPIDNPVRHFPFSDDESIGDIEDLHESIQGKIEDEAHIAKLENLVVESEKYPIALPDTNILELGEGLSLDATAVLNTETGYVTTLVEVESSATTIHNQKVIEARLLLLGSAALYGTNFPLVKILDDSIPVGACTSLRFMMGSIALLPWLLPRNVIGSNSNTINKDHSESWGPFFAGFEVGMWNSVGYISQAVGLQTISASKSAFICSLAVVMVPILDALTGKVLSRKKMFGIFMAVAGVAMLEMGSSIFHATALDSDTLGIGDLISFLQPIAFGIAFWRLEHASSRYPEDSMRITSAQLFAIALASIFYCSQSAPPSVNEVIGWISDLHILSALVWTGLITTALTLYMEAIALRTVTATETTLILSTEPIFGTAFASLLVGERLGLEAAVGAFIILIGCLVSTVADDFDLDSTLLKP